MLPDLLCLLGKVPWCSFGGVGGTTGTLPLLLADVPWPSEHALSSWLLCGAAVMLIVDRGVSLYRLMRNDPTAIAQPVLIENVKSFVTVAHFNEKFSEIAARFLGIEAQIKEQVVKTDEYMHGFRHELRGDMQAMKLSTEDNLQTALSSVSKVHQRVDAVSAQANELKGSLGAVSGSLGEIRTILLQNSQRKGGHS